jgi:hypothetical protein
VRKGERALRVFAPMTVKERDQRGVETGERRVFFKTAFVFDVSQTEPVPGADPEPLEPPSQPLTGSSHEHLLEPLRAFAKSLGFSVRFDALPGAAGGYCDSRERRIVVDAQVAANAQVRTLVHECAHAVGVDYERYSRSQAEVIVDTVTFIVCASIGLAVDGESVPYVAGWGEGGALEAVTEFAETIDRLARRIEETLS